MERLDLYTRDRQHLPLTIERGCPLPPDTYRLVVHICLFNRQGKMLIQQRQSAKCIFPSLWDLSAGGQVTAGETSWQAARRETAEELGLFLSENSLRPKFTMNFPEGFDDVYLLTTDVSLDALRLQEEEVQAVRFADEAAILRMIQDGCFVPYHESYIHLLFTMRDKSGTFIP